MLNSTEGRQKSKRKPFALLRYISPRLISSIGGHAHRMTKGKRATFSLINIQLNYYYTYILKCSDDSYYIGVTNNVERRLIEHQEGINITCYTYSRRPIDLVYFEKFIDILQAIAREKQLKGWSRKKKEALIEERGTDLPNLSVAYRDKK